eukprot:1330100-Prymnesium_polylepis.1
MEGRRARRGGSTAAGLFDGIGSQDRTWRAGNGMCAERETGDRDAHVAWRVSPARAHRPCQSRLTSQLGAGGETASRALMEREFWASIVCVSVCLCVCVCFVSTGQSEALGGRWIHV